LRLCSDDGELQLLTTLTHFGTAVDVTVAELRLEAFLPADEATASILAKRGSAAAWTPSTDIRGPEASDQTLPFP
jgi:hypothetical protein